MIYYEPAFYSLRFPNIKVDLLERTSVLGTQSFQIEIYDDDGWLQ